MGVSARGTLDGWLPKQKQLGKRQLVALHGPSGGGWLGCGEGVSRGVVCDTDFVVVDVAEADDIIKS